MELMGCCSRCRSTTGQLPAPRVSPCFRKEQSRECPMLFQSGFGTLRAESICFPPDMEVLSAGTPRHLFNHQTLAFSSFQPQELFPSCTGDAKAPPSNQPSAGAEVHIQADSSTLPPSLEISFPGCPGGKGSCCFFRNQG